MNIDNSTILDWSLYLERMASEHKDVCHSPRGKHFFQGEIDEFFGALRSDVNFPCLIEESSSISYAQDNGTTRKIRHVAFIIADTYMVDDDYRDIKAHFSDCETIGEDFLQRIDDESGEDISPVLEFEWNTVEVEALQNTQQRYIGMRFTFDIIQPFCRELTKDKIWI